MPLISPLSICPVNHIAFPTSSYDCWLYIRMIMTFIPWLFHCFKIYFNWIPTKSQLNFLCNLTWLLSIVHEYCTRFAYYTWWFSVPMYPFVTLNTTLPQGKPYIQNLTCLVTPSHVFAMLSLQGTWRTGQGPRYEAMTLNLQRRADRLKGKLWG